jgi:hypothetical protein
MATGKLISVKRRNLAMKNDFLGLDLKLSFKGIHLPKANCFPGCLPGRKPRPTGGDGVPESFKGRKPRPQGGDGVPDCTGGNPSAKKSRLPPREGRASRTPEEGIHPLGRIASLFGGNPAAYSSNDNTLISLRSWK